MFCEDSINIPKHQHEAAHGKKNMPRTEPVERASHQRTYEFVRPFSALRLPARRRSEIGCVRVRVFIPAIKRARMSTVERFNVERQQSPSTTTSTGAVSILNSVRRGGSTRRPVGGVE